MTAKPRGRRKGPIVWGALLGVLLIAGFVWFVHTMMQGKTKKPDRQVQVVQIIKPPPPPPDQPPPPPPEKTEEPLPQDQPEPAPAEDAAPQEQLGLDAEGAAGGDAFGLAARKGGSDLVGGSGTALFAWYTNRVRDTIQECLGKDGNGFSSRKFSASLNVFFGPDGRFETKLATTTGDHALDQKIESTLRSCSNTADAPPVEMPRQVNIKIVSRL